MNRETALYLLSDPTRRAVVAVLSRTGPVSRERLVDLVAARAPTPATRDRVRDALAADQLPRLADAGVVAYDAASVRPGPRLADAAAHLSDADRSGGSRGRSAADDGPGLRQRLAGFYA